MSEKSKAALIIFTGENTATMNLGRNIKRHYEISLSQTVLYVSQKCTFNKLSDIVASWVQEKLKYN